jgi:hypothetical protein
VLWQVHGARHSAKKLGGQLGARALKSHPGLHILGLDADPCVIVLIVVSLPLFSKLEHFIMSNYVVNLRTYCNNSHVMILVVTNRPCLRVGYHS